MKKTSLPSSLTSAPVVRADLALDALRISESRYRRLFETAQDGVLLLNADTAQIEDVNPYLIKMLGYSHAEFLGKKLWEVGPFVDRVESKEMFAQLQAQGYVRYEDLPLKTKEGMEIDVEFVSNSYDCAGVKVIQCNIRDITERKRAEKALLREKHFIDAALNSLPGLFYVIDEQARFLRWNTNFETVSGYSAAEISRMSPTELFAGPDQEIIAEKIRQVFLAGDATVEAGFVAKDRTTTPYFFTGKRVQLDQKPGLIGLGIDIAARQRAERNFHDLFESAPDAMVIVNRDADVVLVNAQAVKLFGWCREELLVQKIDILVPERFRSKHPENRHGFFMYPHARPMGAGLDLFGLRKDGTEFPVEISLSPMETSDGTLAITAIRDITERKDAERRIAYLNRVYAMLSGIDTLIVRVRDRDELFREACRIAVDAGGFGMSMIVVMDRSSKTIVPAASAGKDAELLAAINRLVSSPELFSSTMVARAMSGKKPVVSNDSQNDPHVLLGEQYAKAGIRSLAILPLLAADEVAGALVLYAAEIEFFHEEELKLVTELAGDISFAIENIGKDEKFVRLNRVRAVTSAINNLIVQVRDRHKLFDAVCRIAVEKGNFGMAWIGAFDPVTLDVRPVAWAGYATDELGPIGGTARADIPKGQGMVGRAIREKRAAFDNDIAADSSIGAERRAEAVRQGFRSLIALPFIVEGAVVGHLSLFAKEPNFFDHEELNLLTELAGDISYALENISKEEKIDRLNRIEAVTSEINALIVRVQGRQELFNEVCRIAVEHGNFGTAWIGAFDCATLEVSTVAWVGHSAELARTRTTWRTDVVNGTGVVSRAIRQKRPVFDNNIVESAKGDSPRRTEAIRAGFHSLIAVPFVIEDTVVGHLSLYASETDFFDDREVKLLSALARNISFAINSIDRQEKLNKLSRIREVSSQINAAIVRIDDREALLREACRIAGEHGKFELVWIALLNHEKKKVEPVAWTGFSPAVAHAVNWSSINATGGTLGEAILTRKPAVRGDIGIDLSAGGLRHEAMQKGCRSTVCLPLVVDHTVVAVILLFAPGMGFFDEEELALLNELAGDISFAFDHIGKEEKIARLSRIREVTSGVNAAIVRIRDRQELFNETCRIASEHGGFGIVWIGKLDPATQDITPIAWVGIDAARIAITRRSSRADIPEGQGLAGRACREKTAVFDNDIASRPNIGGSGRQDAIGRGYRSLVALPLLVEGAVTGTLSLFAREPDFFDPEELKLLTELAGNISFALEHINHQEKLEKLSRIRAVSGEINAAISRIPETEALLKEVCRIVAEYGKFEFVWVATLDAGKQEIRPVAWTGFTPDVALAATWAGMSIPSATLGEIMQTRRTAVRNDIEVVAGGGVLRQTALKHGCRSMVSLPLLVDDNVVAAINLFATGRDFFDVDELALLNEAAADISLALQSISRREQLDYLAYYDALTGLANRSLFHERLDQGLATAKERRRTLALVLFDVERFRTINDSLGRQVGDAVLKELAVRMTRHAGDAGRLARIDADHFAVMVTDAQTAEELARLIEQRIGEIFHPPFRIGESELRVAAKFGIAMFPADGADADTLFRNAEAALNNARSRGDRYLFYTHSMNARVAENLSLENRLRQAIERDEFVLHYQPKLNLASGKITGAEALIRWNDPQTGLVPPGQFIPLMEETGMIYEVGRWALRQAIADYLRWRGAGLPAVRIAVNVSPLQLRDRSFVAQIAGKIGIDAHAASGLELEITESLIMEDVKHSIAILQEIHELGVTIAIDDFGTGFSSLSYLARLPVDTLKIDRSFVIDMTNGPEGLALVSTIINLAHALKRKVVAEGVETEEQQRLLRLLNCDEMQGYLFSRPVPTEVFEAKFLAAPPAG